MPERPVLIVDDSQDTREMLQIWLEASGFRVVLAEGGAEAVGKALTFRPQVVLMDIGLPQMDGLEATRLIKGNSETVDTVIICLTGMAEPQRREAALAAGCAQVLIKPCSLPDVLAAVQKAYKSEPEATV